MDLESRDMTCLWDTYAEDYDANVDEIDTRTIFDFVIKYAPVIHAATGVDPSMYARYSDVGVLTELARVTRERVRTILAIPVREQSVIPRNSPSTWRAPLY